MPNHTAQALIELPVYVGEVVFDDSPTATDEQLDQEQLIGQTFRKVVTALSTTLEQAPAGCWLLLAAGAMGLALWAHYQAKENVHARS